MKKREMRSWTRTWDQMSEHIFATYLCIIPKYILHACYSTCSLSTKFLTFSAKNNPSHPPTRASSPFLHDFAAHLPRTDTSTGQYATWSHLDATSTHDPSSTTHTTRIRPSHTAPGPSLPNADRTWTAPPVPLTCVAIARRQCSVLHTLASPLLLLLLLLLRYWGRRWVHLEWFGEKILIVGGVLERRSLREWLIGGPLISEMAELSRGRWR